MEHFFNFFFLFEESPMKAKQIKKNKTIVANIDDLVAGVNITNEVKQQLKNCVVLLKRSSVGLAETQTVSESQIVLRRSNRKKNVNCIQNENSLSQKPSAKSPKPNTQIISKIQLSTIIWKEVKAKNFQLDIGLIVLSKMSTFWPWPSQIIEIKNKRVRVKFFGDLREGIVDKCNCVPFGECHLVVLSYLKSLDSNLKKKWIEELESTIDSATRFQVTRKMPIRQLYMQAIRDVEIYEGLADSIKDSVLSSNAHFN